MTTALQPPPSASPQERSPADGPKEPVDARPLGEGAFWGDRFALQVWVVCFAFQWLIVLVSSLTGLRRW
jgi:hypothetical protein